MNCEEEDINCGKDPKQQEYCYNTNQVNESGGWDGK